MSKTTQSAKGVRVGGNFTQAASGPAQQDVEDADVGGHLTQATTSDVSEHDLKAIQSSLEEIAARQFEMLGKIVLQLRRNELASVENADLEKSIYAILEDAGVRETAKTFRASNPIEWEKLMRYGGVAVAAAFSHYFK